MNRTIKTLATLAMVLGIIPAPAHHSGAIWDASKTLTLSGLVREFQWTNPHCWIQLVVPSSDPAAGAPEEWSIEMAAPIQVLQGGWKPGTLKVGDHISVTVHPARDGHRSGNFMSAVGADGLILGKAKQEQTP